MISNYIKLSQIFFKKIEFTFKIVNSLEFINNHR